MLCSRQVPNSMASVIFVALPTALARAAAELAARHEVPQALLRCIVVRWHQRVHHKHEQFVQVPFHARSPCALRHLLLYLGRTPPATPVQSASPLPAVSRCAFLGLPVSTPASRSRGATCRGG